MTKQTARKGGSADGPSERVEQVIYKTHPWEIPPEFEAVPEKKQIWLLAAHSLGLIEQACGGRWPETMDDLHRLVFHFTNKRLRLVEAGTDMEALTRENGRIYVENCSDPEKMRLQILHELIEAMWRWEGVPPCVTQADSHDIANVAMNMLT